MKNNPPDRDARSPRTALELERYYDLRWRVLRAPWDQPKGSERDELEPDSFQMAVWDGEIPIAVGRLHFNDPTEAQVRYMAVEPERRGSGLGGQILELLEARAKMEGAKRIVLNAREEAAEFYRRHGYHIIGAAELLFGSIAHVKMAKILNEPGETLLISRD